MVASVRCMSPAWTSSSYALSIRIKSSSRKVPRHVRLVAAQERLGHGRELRIHWCASVGGGRYWCPDYGANAGREQAASAIHPRPSRREFAITKSDVTAIAAACQTGLTRPPPIGNNTPPAIGAA